MMNKPKTQLSDFIFVFSGDGHYKVTYCSPVTGKQWTKTIDDMPLIDATRGAEDIKQKDLDTLKRVCKRTTT